MTLMTSKKIDIQARKLYLEFALMNLDSDETSRDIRTAVLHRMSIPFIWAEWFGLGGAFLKKIQNINKMIFFKKGHVQKIQKCQFLEKKNAGGQ